MTEAGLTRVIRNSLVRASKKHQLIRGSCGLYKICGSRWNGTAWVFDRKSGIEPMCAFLADKGVEQSDAADPEGAMADLLEVPRDWVISFLQGWDGDASARAQVPKAFRLGKRLAGQFVEG